MGGEEGLGVTTGQPNLYKQDLSKLDVGKLTALSREVISRQATINIGTIGHVAHGKSTIVKAISGVQTVRFKNELERNITIKLDARAEECGDAENMDFSEDIRNVSIIGSKRSASYIRSDQQSPAKQSRFETDRYTIAARLAQQPEGSLKILDNIHSSDRICSPKQYKHKSEYTDKTSKEEVKKIQASKDTSPHFAEFQLKELRVVLEDVNHSSKDAFVKPYRVQSRELSKQDNGLWEVESILKKSERKGVVVYLIKWKNWGYDYNTWEPLQNLVNCSDLLQDFEAGRIRLLTEFKSKTNFYPRMHDVEEYLNKFLSDGGSIDNMPPPDENVLYSNIRKFLKPKSTKNIKKLKELIKCDILHSLLYTLRKQQLHSLQEWENEMNSITKGKPIIKIENRVDLENAPVDFFYIDSYLPGAGVIIPEDPPIGCECVSCDSKTKCCFTQYDVSFPYTSTSRIRVPPGTPIYECNKRCTCDLSCPNRVVQRGTDTKLCIFRTFNGRGWGVKTLRAIKKGTFVTQYVGEVLTSDEAEKRGREYDAAGRTYLFDLDYNETEGQCPYTVDAAIYGNISHFINHSCDPNLAVYGVWINCLDPNLPNLALFSTRDIKQNEEITFDYMCQSAKTNEKLIMQHSNINKDNDNISPKKIKMSSEVLDSTPLVNKVLCKCGASTCRQYLF